MTAFFIYTQADEGGSETDKTGHNGSKAEEASEIRLAFCAAICQTGRLAVFSVISPSNPHAKQDPPADLSIGLSPVSGSFWVV